MTVESDNRLISAVPGQTRSNIRRAIRRPLGIIRRQLMQAKYTGRRRFRDAIVGNFIVPTMYRRRLNRYRVGAPDSPAGHSPRFLYLRSKYFPFDMGGKELIPVFDNIGPLRSSKVADVAEYFYDQDYSGGILGDQKLVDQVIAYRPDLIILSAYSYRNREHPSFSALRAIHHRCGIPILVEWGDSMGPKSVEDCYHMMDSVDLNVIWDSGNLVRHFKGDSKFLRLWTAFDFSLFHPGNGPRDIDVSFVGFTDGYRNVRVEYLRHLQRNQAGVYLGGGRGQDRMESDDYADVMRRSKISLNFSYSIPGTHQLKGRVFQVMFSGALLMENANEETSQYFTPMVDYVPFDSKEDLVDKCRYYLEHDSEREAIAHNGYVKATTKYNHQVYWDTIMGRLRELELISAPVESNQV